MGGVSEARGGGGGRVVGVGGWIESGEGSRSVNTRPPGRRCASSTTTSCPASESATRRRARRVPRRGSRHAAGPRRESGRGSSARPAAAKPESRRKSRRSRPVTVARSRQKRSQAASRRPSFGSRMSEEQPVAEVAQRLRQAGVAAGDQHGVVDRHEVGRRSPRPERRGRARSPEGRLAGERVDDDEAAPVEPGDAALQVQDPGTPRMSTVADVKPCRPR